MRIDLREGPVDVGFYQRQVPPWTIPGWDIAWHRRIGEFSCWSLDVMIQRDSTDVLVIDDCRTLAEDGAACFSGFASVDYARALNTAAEDAEAYEEDKIRVEPEDHDYAAHIEYQGDITIEEPGYVSLWPAMSIIEVDVPAARLISSTMLAAHATAFEKSLDDGLPALSWLPPERRIFSERW